MGELRGAEVISFAEALDVSDSGKFGSRIELPTSPKNAQDAWNSQRPTTLYRVDPAVHCLALDGDAKKFQGVEFYVACAAKGTGTSPDVCAVGTHAQRSRPRMTLQGAAFLVRVRPSSAATKPKVLAGVYLLEADLPLTLVECGFVEMLQEFEAPPAVWKFMLEHYPGRTTMTAFLEEGDEPSSGESKQGEAGRGPFKSPRKPTGY